MDGRQNPMSYRMDEMGNTYDPSTLLFQQQQQPNFQPVSNIPMNTRNGKTEGMWQHVQIPIQQQMAQQQQPTVANPFDILGIPRSTTEEQVVMQAFRKWAAVLHPDRGGDPRRFQAVNEAYVVIMETLKHAKSESFEHLKFRTAKDTTNARAAADQGAAPLGAGKAFDTRKFNQVFSDHQMWTPAQDGYSEFMVGSVKDTTSMTPEQLMAARQSEVHAVEPILNKYDKKEFNAIFKTKATYLPRNQGGESTALVRRFEPESMTFQGSTSMAESLSYEKVTDFSSPFASGGGSGSCAFTDYMKAFSEDALITPHVDESALGGNQYRSVEDFEKHRAAISFKADPALEQARAQQEASEREQDELRYRNFLKQQEAIEERARAIRNVLGDK